MATSAATRKPSAAKAATSIQIEWACDLLLRALPHDHWITRVSAMQRLSLAPEIALDLLDNAVRLGWLQSLRNQEKPELDEVCLPTKCWLPARCRQTPTLDVT
jgi:hypothetical protein